MSNFDITELLTDRRTDERTDEWKSGHLCRKVNGAQNIGQGHWVNVPAKSGGQGDVSCKV